MRREYRCTNTGCDEPFRSPYEQTCRACGERRTQFNMGHHAATAAHQRALEAAKASLPPDGSRGQADQWDFLTHKVGRYEVILRRALEVLEWSNHLPTESLEAAADTLREDILEALR